MVRTKIKCRYKRTKRPARKPNKAGRRGYYEDWMADKASELMGKLGATQKDLAEFFNVNIGTIEYWIRTKSQFKAAVKQARLQKTLKVSQALYHRAVGYSHPDVHIMANRVKDYDEEGRLIQERTEPLLIPITKHYPPDTTAAIKMLSILKRDVWAEQTQFQHQHNIQGEVNINNVQELSMDDLTTEMKEMLFQLNLKQLSEPQSN